MSELGCARVLLGVGLRDHLINRSPDGDLIGQVGSKSSIKVCRTCLQMGSEPSILQWKVIVLLFVHLFIDNILLGHSERTAGSSLVYL